MAGACCIGVEHPRWQERPLLLIVRNAGAGVAEAAVRAFRAGKIAKW